MVRDVVYNQSTDDFTVSVKDLSKDEVKTDWHFRKANDDFSVSAKDLVKDEKRRKAIMTRISNPLYALS